MLVVYCPLILVAQTNVKNLDGDGYRESEANCPVSSLSLETTISEALTERLIQCQMCTLVIHEVVILR